MDINEHTTPEKLERYAFLWSEARLLIAALALFIGGIPPVLAYNPFPDMYSMISSLLTLAWIISGIVSIYLIYLWNNNDKKLFGENDMKDTVAFFINIVSGFNLGIAGVLGTNIGMTISSEQSLFTITALLYLAAGGYLFWRWKGNGERLFEKSTVHNPVDNH